MESSSTTASSSQSRVKKETLDARSSHRGWATPRHRARVQFARARLYSLLAKAQHATRGNVAGSRDQVHRTGLGRGTSKHTHIVSEYACRGEREIHPGRIENKGFNLWCQRSKLPAQCDYSPLRTCTLMDDMFALLGLHLYSPESEGWAACMRSQEVVTSLPFSVITDTPPRGLS